VELEAREFEFQFTDIEDTTDADAIGDEPIWHGKTAGWVTSAAFDPSGALMRA